jgi:methionyl-tRNA formyltransferase
VELAEPSPAGTIVAVDADGPVVACGEGGLVLQEVDAGAAELVVGARLG